MPGEVPTGWTISPFSGVARVERGLTYSNEQECEAAEPGAACVLRIPNVQQQRFAPHDLKYIRGVPAKQVQKYSVPRKSILMVGSNGNADRVGNCCFVDSEEQYLFASFLMRVVPDIARADAQFFYYLIAGGEVQAAITDAVAGTTGLKNISLEMLRGYPLALPPLPEQKKIAAILSSVDEAIQATQAVIDQTRRVKEGLLQDLLTRGIGHTRFKQTEIGEIPEGWEVRSLSGLAEFVTSGSRGWSEFYAESGALFIRITNLSRESIEIDLSKPQYVALPPGSSEGTRTRLREGDVLVSITADLGIIGLVGSDLGEAYVNQHIALIRLDGRGSVPAFVAYYLASTAGQKQFGLRNDAGAKAGLTLPSVRSVRVPVPSVAEQEAIVQQIRATEVEVAQCEAAAKLLAGVKAGLLTDLLTGKVRVTP